VNEFLQRADLVGLAAATLLASTPLVLAALGGVMSERSGVVNIALEGIMLTGAFMGYVAALATHNLWFGVGVAILSGALPKKMRSGGLSASTTLRIALRVAVGSPGLSAHERLCPSRTSA